MAGISEQTFTGFGDLTKALQTIEREMTDAVARKAVRAGADVIADAMQAAAPVLDKRTAKSTSLAPGELKRDIRGRNSRGDSDGEVAAEAGPTGKTAHVARWVEYGHRNVKGGYSKIVANGKTRGPGKAGQVDTPPHPFLRPAYDASVEAAEDARDAVLREGLEGKS